MFVSPLGSPWISNFWNLSFRKIKNIQTHFRLHACMISRRKWGPFVKTNCCFSNKIVRIREQSARVFDSLWRERERARAIKRRSGKGRKNGGERVKGAEREREKEGREFAHSSAESSKEIEMRVISLPLSLSHPLLTPFSPSRVFPS